MPYDNRPLAWEFGWVDNSRWEERNKRDQVTWVYLSIPEGFWRETTFFLDKCPTVAPFLPRIVPSHRYYIHIQSGQKATTLEGLFVLLASQ